MKSTLIPNIGEDSLQGKEGVSVGALSLKMETGVQTAITLSLSFLLPASWIALLLRYSPVSLRSLPSQPGS